MQEQARPTPRRTTGHKLLPELIYNTQTHQKTRNVGTSRKISKFSRLKSQGRDSAARENRSSDTNISKLIELS